MRFVYITSQPGWYELVGNDIVLRKTQHDLVGKEWRYVEEPSVISVAYGEIESVDPVQVSEEFAKDYNKYVSDKMEHPCVHIPKSISLFSTNELYCLKCGIKLGN